VKVRFEGVDDMLRTLLLDPQTSGGLLVGVPPAHAGAWQRASAAKGVLSVEVGEVIAGSAGVIVVS
jgi:selenophosphate synthase